VKEASAAVFGSPDVVVVVVVAVADDAFAAQDVRKDFVAAKIGDPTLWYPSTVASYHNLEFPVKIKFEIIIKYLFITLIFGLFLLTTF
jgi:hypothetical protein